MKYSDNHLLELICESSEEAKDEIYERYKYIIDIYLKKYNKIRKALKIEKSDLHQEALVGFSDAINSYRGDKDAGLASFISLCVDRRLKSVIVKASRIKSQLFNDAMSIDYSYTENTTLKDILSDGNKNNPLEKITVDESYEELLKNITKELSNKEYSIFYFLVRGLNNKEIALLLNKDLKQINNTITRIKAKTKKILDKRN